MLLRLSIKLLKEKQAELKSHNAKLLKFKNSLNRVRHQWLNFKLCFL